MLVAVIGLKLSEECMDEHGRRTRRRHGIESCSRRVCAAAAKP